MKRPDASPLSLKEARWTILDITASEHWRRAGRGAVCAYLGYAIPELVQYGDTPRGWGMGVLGLSLAFIGRKVRPNHYQARLEKERVVAQFAAEHETVGPISMPETNAEQQVASTTRKGNLEAALAGGAVSIAESTLMGLGLGAALGGVAWVEGELRTRKDEKLTDVNLLAQLDAIAARESS